MSLEQLLLLAAIAVYALFHWLARRRLGKPRPTTPKLREGYPEREPDAISRVAFEPVENETDLQIEPARAPRSVPRERPMRAPQRREPPAPLRPGAHLAKQRAVTRVGLDWQALRPRNQTELRRAMALVAIFGPPRSLDPPP